MLIYLYNTAMRILLLRFFCLVPYDLITLEVWDKVMSQWMEAINREVKREELHELKSIFCKIFDPDMSPLGFDVKEMYHFISKRFHRTTAEVSMTIAGHSSTLGCVQQTFFTVRSNSKLCNGFKNFAS